jgi:phage shock protein A
MEYRLRMPAQLADWFAELQTSEPVTAVEVGAAIVALVDADEIPGPPLVTDPSAPAPADPRETLDDTYQDLLEGLQRIRRRVADAGTKRAHAERRLSELRAESDHDPAQVAVLERQSAEAQQLEKELTDRSLRLQIRVDRFRTQKETMKASYTAAEAQARISEAAAELDRLLAQADRTWPEAGPDRADNGVPANDEDETSPGNPASEVDADEDESVERATIRRYSTPPDTAPPRDAAGPGVTAPGADDGPEERYGLAAHGAAQRSQSEASSDVLELNADPFGADIRVLFAIEPEDTVTLLAVLEGSEAIRDSKDEAVDLAGELLDEIRAAGSAPATDEADDEWLEFAGPTPFLQRFFADNGGAIAERAVALAAGESLAGLRERRGISLVELARSAGISQWRLSLIEHDGLRSAAVSEVAAYVRALGGRLELAADIDGERHGLA